MSSNNQLQTLLPMANLFFDSLSTYIMRKFLIVSACFCCIACSGGSNNSAKIPSDFDSKTLQANEEHLEQLVDKSRIADLLDVAEDELQVIYEDYSQNPAMHMLLFSWENGRSKSIEVNGKEVQLPEFSSIGFGRIEQLTLTEFEKKYQPKTAESVKAEIKAVTTDEAINSDAAIWEAKEIARNAKSQTFEKLANIGEQAYWETPINVLHVWVGGQAFSISSNLDPNTEQNKNKAIQLAELIFQHSNSVSL